MVPRTSSYDSATAARTTEPVKAASRDAVVCRPRNPVGEPDAVNPHVRFDERGVETEYGRILRHWQPKGPATRTAYLTHRATPRLY